MTVAIIAEYNPFHSGHLYQIEQIRTRYGENTRIIALMNGNYVQRGEVAVFDKALRAECACRLGVDLVLELPFPHAILSAPLYARAAVSVLTRLGIVDALAFGSECGDLCLLETVCEGMSRKEYQATLMQIMKDEPSLGFPKQRELAYLHLYGPLPADFFSPNNLLGLEYLLALREQNSPIRPITLRRVGAYHNKELSETEFSGATAIRKQLFAGKLPSDAKALPPTAYQLYRQHLQSGAAPADIERLAPAIISYFRCNPTPNSPHLHDLGGGLYNRLAAGAVLANNINALTVHTETKKFTNARIRRGILYAFFGVTSSEAKAMPAYTGVLAMNEIGACLLRAAKKSAAIPILTKPSATASLDDEARAAKKKADRADAVYQLTKPCPPVGNLALKTTPFCLK